jgi:hypothetical protein
MTFEEDNSDLGKTLKLPSGADLGFRGHIIGCVVKYALLLDKTLSFYHKRHDHHTN